MSAEPQIALKYEVEVGTDGHVDLQVPFKPGVRLVVFVLEEPAESLVDLTAAAQSSLAFWDNPLDDEDWNNA